MKIPSLDYLFQNAKDSLLRFPLTILSAFVAVCIGIYITEFREEIDNFFPYINSLLTSALGIPLFFCVAIFNRKFEFGQGLKIAFHLAALLLLLAIFFSLPDSELTNNSTLPYIRYTIFNITFHLLVSYIPYVNNKSLNGFWNYNKTLFIRFWVAVLYSGFLYTGVTSALGALDLLFDINLSSEIYIDIFIVTSGLFNTWFFVSGVPRDLDQLDDVKTYPKGLKIFSQYILLPILIIYLVILYSYMAKIIFTWNWPEGIVSYLIACVSTLGILTILLVYPYSHSKENGWINKFSRAYYFILMPLIAVLFIAIGFRIADYGITVNRYIIVLLGAWLSFISIYFSLKNKNIKVIPLSLSAAILLMSFGPWGMFSVSEESQADRLMHILENNGLVKNGKVQNEPNWKLSALPRFTAENTNSNEGLLNDSLHNEVKSILDYLDNHHGFSSIKSLYSQNIDSLIKVSLDSNKYISEAEVYMESLGLEYQLRYLNNIEKVNGYSYRIASNGVKKVFPYTYYYAFNGDYYAASDERKVLSIDLDSISLKLEIHHINNSIKVLEPSDTVTFNLNDMVNSLKERYGIDYYNDIPAKDMVVVLESNRCQYKVQLTYLNLAKRDGELIIKNINGYLLFRRKIQAI